MVGKEAIAIEAAQLLQCLVFDLADALPTDLQLLTNFGQRVLVAVAKPEAELQDQFIARSQRIECGTDVPLEHRFAGGLVWGLRDFVGDQITEAGLVLAADW